jgi:hypothetical protein
MVAVLRAGAGAGCDAFTFEAFDCCYLGSHELEGVEVGRSTFAGDTARMTVLCGCPCV